MLEQHRVAADHVDAGRDHRRGMDESRDGRRALHGVGQPDIQWNLRRLAGGADEEQQRDERQHAEGRLDRHRLHGLADGHEVERPDRPEQQQRPQDEGVVTDAVDDKRLLRRVRGRCLFVVVADEQVGAEPHAFPADEHDQRVGAEHEQQHEEDEEVQVGEVPREVGVGLLVHVGRRVDVDERADAGDDEDHHGRQRIEAEAHVEREAPGRHPGEQHLGNLAGLGRHAHERPHLRGRDGKGRQHHGRGQAARHALGQTLPHRRIDEEAGKRKQRYQREHWITISAR